MNGSSNSVIIVHLSPILLKISKMYLLFNLTLEGCLGNSVSQVSAFALSPGIESPIGLSNKWEASFSLSVCPSLIQNFQLMSK